MWESLFQMPSLRVFFLICSASIIFSCIAIILIRRFVSPRVQYKDNPVIGNIAATIGVIYGVLVGLTALYLFNNNSYTADAVQREANAVADLYRDSIWLKDPMRRNVQNDIKKYIYEVINIEWQVMKEGKRVDKKGLYIINDIESQLHAADAESKDVYILREMLQETKALYDAREQRIHMSYSELSPEIWIVVFIGTILTIGINYLFGMNFYFHIITVSAVSLMASSMIFLLMTLDRPFQGEFVIEPSALRMVAEFIDEKSVLQDKTNYKNYEF